MEMPGKVVHFEIPADNVEPPVDQKTQMPTEPGAINGGMTKRQDPVKNTVITIDVSDIDSTLKTVEKLGGKTIQKKQAVANMGFTAYFKDTEGNIVGLWQTARR